MMRFWLFFILLGVLVGFSHLSIAQPEKDNKFNDTNSNTIKTPALEKDTVVNTDQDKKKVNPNLNNPLIDAQTDPISNDEVTIFNLNKQPSLVSEDLYNIDIGESEVVRVVEEINIGDVNDPAWIKIAEYYKIWDTQQINPYGKDAKSFSEVVYLKLYDPSIGQLWASPLESTYTTSGFGPRWGRYHHGIDYTYIQAHLFTQYLMVLSEFQGSILVVMDTMW
ncbi:MAG TPA: hypothetical protein DCM08_08405 [Microscillaceae bacterium]|nr:hypothetical protein [Microscillaceae bacterium]